jgi:hypothetical protein
MHLRSIGYSTSIEKLRSEGPVNLFLLSVSSGHKLTCLFLADVAKSVSIDAAETRML